MARAEDPNASVRTASLADRLKEAYGEDVDPQISLGGEEPPPLTAATIRVRRGGSFANRASQSRVGYRESDSLADRYGDLGLRPARVVQSATPDPGRR